MVFTKTAARFYLAGMLDGEGTVTDPDQLLRHSRSVRITNTDRELIAACEACCLMLGLRYSVTERSAKRCKVKRTYDLAFYGRDNFEKLNKLPVRSPEKARRLRGLVASYRRPKRPTRSTLLERSVVESLAQLAARYGVTQKTVRRWLKQK